MAQLKRSIVEVKAEDNCLAHAIIIAIAKVKNDQNYKTYQGRKIRQVVRNLFVTTGINLSRGGIPELVKFQEHLRDYKITVYQGLACEDNVRKAGRLPKAN